VRVGHSWAADPFTAGVQATREALDLAEPKLLLVFASGGYQLDRLLAGVRSVSGDTPLIGCSTSGELGPRPEPRDGVVVACLGGAFTVTTARATDLSEQPREVGETIGRALLPLPPTRHRVVLLLTDPLIAHPLAGDQQEMVRGVYGVLGATVPLVGGGAGDQLGAATCQHLYGDQILHDSVVAASIGTDGPIGLSVRHGWRRQGEAMVVTGSSGRYLHSLDDRPALDVYLDRFRAPAGLLDDPAAFATFTLTRPLAIARRGDVAVRQVVGACPASRALICAASMPRGAASWLVSVDTKDMLAAADEACADAIGQLGGEPLRALLVFDCVGRRSALGDDGRAQERRLLGEHAGGAALAGFYCAGEIARGRGVNGYHNQTIVALALS
jgi:hypothetical protein